MSLHVDKETSRRARKDFRRDRTNRCGQVGNTGGRPRTRDRHFISDRIRAELGRNLRSRCYKVPHENFARPPRRSCPRVYNPLRSARYVSEPPSRLDLYDSRSDSTNGTNKVAGRSGAAGVKIEGGREGGGGVGEGYQI